LSGYLTLAVRLIGWVYSAIHNVINDITVSTRFIPQVIPQSCGTTIFRNSTIASLCCRIKMAAEELVPQF